MSEIVPRQHIRKECVDKNCNGNCNVCCLFVCSVCGLAEMSLTTHCPGVHVDAVREQAVMAHLIDFRYGTWIPGKLLNKP